VKIRIVFSVFVLGAIVALSMFYLNGSAGAATTGTVSPSVTVSSTLSLALEDGTNVEWGSKPAGTTQTGIVQARVTSNTNWTLYVKRTSDTGITCGLAGEDGTHHTASSSFTYTSTSGSPAPPAGSGVGATQFNTTDTDVWTGGAATGDCKVAVTYSLVIPGDQYPQVYSATHTYTVVPS
jgi:hypothetical protein